MAHVKEACIPLRDSIHFEIPLITVYGGFGRTFPPPPVQLPALGYQLSQQLHGAAVVVYVILRLARLLPHLQN